MERGEALESEHRVHVAVVRADGSLLARAGEPERLTVLRSAAKPFQALPLVEEGVLEALGIREEELAVACASHSGEPEHLAHVSALLARSGSGESDLECGPHPPLGEGAARALAASGAEPRPIHNNCSGKHAGMLALAVHMGWPRAGYSRAGHPVQDRMRAEVARWTGVPAWDIRGGVDGCGVVCFGVPLRAAARAFAALARAAASDEAAGRVVSAMTGNPFLVGGTGRLCTVLMQAAGGGLLVKVGAEGVYGAALTDGALGIALKVEDGARRAAEVALVGVLDRLGFLPSHADLGERYRNPPVRNTRGEEVGRVRVEGELR